MSTYTNIHNIHYVGVEETFKNVLANIKVRDDNFPLQIINLGGPIEYDSDIISSSTNHKTETIILSNRRYDIDDPLGHLESDLLNKYKHSILYRTSPLDITIDIYRTWANATGLLLTAFSPEGVNWMNTKDVAESCLVSKENIRKRSGKAFELTGPKPISMETLRSSFEEELEKSIELKCLNKKDLKNALMQNKIPLEIVEWLAEFQEKSSDNRMQNTTQTLEQIIGHFPREPQLLRNRD